MTIAIGFPVDPADVLAIQSNAQTALAQSAQAKSDAQAALAAASGALPDTVSALLGLMTATISTLPTSQGGSPRWWNNNGVMTYS